MSGIHSGLLGYRAASFCTAFLLLDQYLVDRRWKLVNSWALTLAGLPPVSLVQEC
jgi:hypothetical protein